LLQTAPTGVTELFHSNSGGAWNSSRAFTKAEEPFSGVNLMVKSPWPTPPRGTKNSLTTPAAGGEKKDIRA
jgi:hypothetical protein